MGAILGVNLGLSLGVNLGVNLGGNSGDLIFGVVFIDRGFWGVHFEGKLLC